MEDKILDSIDENKESKPVAILIWKTLVIIYASAYVINSFVFNSILSFGNYILSGVLLVFNLLVLIMFRNKLNRLYKIVSIILMLLLLGHVWGYSSSLLNGL